MSRDRAAFFEKAVQSSAQPFASAHPDGSFMNINRAFGELIGYSADEMETMNWISGITPPEWRELTVKMIARVHETGKPQTYEKDTCGKTELGCRWK